MLNLIFRHSNWKQCRGSTDQDAGVQGPHRTWWDAGAPPCWGGGGGGSREVKPPSQTQGAVFGTHFRPLSAQKLIKTKKHLEKSESTFSLLSPSQLNFTMYLHTIICNHAVSCNHNTAKVTGFTILHLYKFRTVEQGPHSLQLC